jgi:hypothetical protein
VPIDFYPLVNASADDTGNGKIDLTCFGFSTPNAAPEIGQSYGTGLIEITLLAVDEAGGEAPPLVPDEVVCLIDLELIAEDSAYTTDTGFGEIEIVGNGFALLPNEDVGIGQIQISLTAGSPTPFEDSIFHVEQLSMMGGAIGIFVEEVTDEVLLAMAVGSLPISVLRDMLDVSADVLSASDAIRQLTSSVGFTDTMFAIERMLVEESITLNATTAAQGVGLLSVMERLVLAGIATSAADAISQITEAIALNAVLELVNRERVADTVAFDTQVASAFTAAEALVDTLMLDALPAGQGRVSMLVVDSVALSGEPLSQATAISQLRDAASFALTVALNDGVYMATVVNAMTKGTTEYRNYPFNSFALLGGRYFGMSPDGIRLLEGDDDDGDPIIWRARLARTNLGTLNLKRMRPAYMPSRPARRARRA